MAELIPNVGRGSKDAYAVVERAAFDEVNLDPTTFPRYCSVKGGRVKVKVSPESYRHLAKLAPAEQDALGVARPLALGQGEQLRAKCRTTARSVGYAVPCPDTVQRPGVPVWVAGSYGRPRPLRRAARYQGFVPVDLEHPDQLAEMVADLAALRREAGTAATEPYDIVAALPVGNDPEPYRAAGATWWLVEFAADNVSVDRVHAIIRDGPIAP